MKTYAEIVLHIQLDRIDDDGKKWYSYTFDNGQKLNNYNTVESLADEIYWSYHEGADNER